MNSKNSQKGFTIIELMVAIIVFSAVLMLCAYAILHVGRMYHKGTLVNAVQDASRRLGDDVVQAIQFGAGSNSIAFIRNPATTQTFGVAPNTVEVNAICIGEIRYSYAVNGAKNINGVRNVAWKDRVSADYAECAPQDLTQQTPSVNGEDMLGDTMRIPVFEVVEIGTASLQRTIRVRLVIAYGRDTGLFEPTPPFQICRGVNASGQFCATANYETLATKRL